MAKTEEIMVNWERSDAGSSPTAPPATDEKPGFFDRLFKSN